MKSNPYLNFNGQCEEAFKFYQQILGGNIVSNMKWGEMPGGEIPPGSHNLIMHTKLQFNDNVLMGADALPDGYEKPKGISVALHFTGTTEGERIFNALAEGGSIKMPFQQTFWAAGFGMCVDRFGIPWLVNCEQPVSR